MNTIEVVGFSASLLSVLNQFPQAVKVFTTKDTHSISLVMYCIVVACISLWLVYGVMLNNAPLNLGKRTVSNSHNLYFCHKTYQYNQRKR